MLIRTGCFRRQVLSEVTTATGTGHLQKGHGVGFADLDNDGAQDIYAVIGGARLGDNYRNALFLNPGNTNHWLKLKLVGIRSNRAAVGARINVTVATQAGPRHIFKTSQRRHRLNPFRQKSDWATPRRSRRLKSFGGTGVQQRLTGLELDRAYRISENDTNAVVMDSKRFEFDLRPNTPIRTSTGGHDVVMTSGVLADYESGDPRPPVASCRNGIELVGEAAEVRKPFPRLGPFFRARNSARQWHAALDIPHRLSFCSGCSC
jgi:hypothetical protein